MKASIREGYKQLGRAEAKILRYVTSAVPTLRYVTPQLTDRECDNVLPVQGGDGGMLINRGNWKKVGQSPQECRLFQQRSHTKSQGIESGDLPIELSGMEVKVPPKQITIAKREIPRQSAASSTSFTALTKKTLSHRQECWSVCLSVCLCPTRPKVVPLSVG